jgi:hypothetical protein
METILNKQPSSSPETIFSMLSNYFKKLLKWNPPGGDVKKGD